MTDEVNGHLLDLYEEQRRQEDFAKRRAAKEYVKYGVDECSANGQSHESDMQPQPDGRWYCKYCGAELLPENAAVMQAYYDHG